MTDETASITAVRVACSAPLSAVADALPTEFRIFREGLNQTSKGPIVYDAEAAAAVLATYDKEGVDLIIDLQHGVLDEGAAKRSDSEDARGHFKLEQRGGELWATQVAWSPDGARRLREKTQRYISPLAIVDTDTDRALSLINVALVSMPATYQAAPLVAAAKAPRVARKASACKASKVASKGLRRLSKMNPETLKKILDVIASQDQAAALALLPEIVAADATEEAAEAPPAATEALAETADPAAPKPGEAPGPEKAAMSVLSKLVGASSPGETVAALSAMIADVAKIKADAAVVELDSRRSLIADLIKLEVETPALAWVGDPSKLIPCKRLASEPVAELRARVVALKALRPESREVAPPVAPVGDISGLSPQKLKQIHDAGMTPEQFIAAKKNAVKRVG